MHLELAHQPLLHHAPALRPARCAARAERDRVDELDILLNALSAFTHDSEQKEKQLFADSSIDRAVGAQDKQLRDLEAGGFGGLQVDDHLETRRSLDGNLASTATMGMDVVASGPQHPDAPHLPRALRLCGKRREQKSARRAVMYLGRDSAAGRLWPIHIWRECPSHC